MVEEAQHWGPCCRHACPIDKILQNIWNNFWNAIQESALFLVVQIHTYICVSTQRQQKGRSRAWVYEGTPPTTETWTQHGDSDSALVLA